MLRVGGWDNCDNNGGCGNNNMGWYTIIYRGGGVVYIAKYGGGGICWSKRGATSDRSLEAQWLAERLAAAGVVVIIG